MKVWCLCLLAMWVGAFIEAADLKNLQGWLVIVSVATVLVLLVCGWRAL